MDTSDPKITFDVLGVCCHCLRFDELSPKCWFPGEKGKKTLKSLINRIRDEGRGSEYNCILGLSGGIDSSYLALKVKAFGLRPLAVHIDTGWNTELAVSNIEKIVKHCGFDLHTHVMDWQDMRSLQLAYLRAAVANQDVPQDHAIFANLYDLAVDHRIKFVLSGGNFATESIFPGTWLGDPMDAANLHAIHGAYGSEPLNTYRTISSFDYYFAYPFIHGMRTIRLLNFMPYNVKEAQSELVNVGWSPYRRKHCESVFTALFLNYYLPTKFGYDPRRPHLSSLIASGQLSRDEALASLREPLYDPYQIKSDIAYFCKKLNISRRQFDNFMDAPVHHYSDFDNQDRVYRMVKWFQSIFEDIVGERIRVYS